jgi:cytosine/adenosine deaminase-related metal-dependent hydrolase
MIERHILHAAEHLYAPGRDGLLRDHGVLFDGHGHVIAVGPTKALALAADERIDHSIAMPGVVNAHTHLTDAGRATPVPGGDGLVAWVGRLLAERRDETPEEILTAAPRTLEEMYRGGTIAVGEVANDDRTIDALESYAGDACLIAELIAFKESGADSAMERGEALRHAVPTRGDRSFSFGAHAPYSVSPTLMTMIASESALLDRPFYQHLAEDPDERLLYETGEGPWVDFLKGLGAWDDAFKPPGLSPIPFYDRLGIIDERFVAVHLTDATTEEIALLAHRGAGVILSPTSNRHITGLLPNVEEMVARGMRLALGTDGRGSNRSMNVFDEARLIGELFPTLTPGVLLHALTVGGADILGTDTIGDFRAGTKPGLIAVNAEVRGDSLGDLERAILFSDAREMIGFEG